MKIFYDETLLFYFSPMVNREAYLKDALDGEYTLTTKIEATEVRPEDILIGVIRLSTRLVLGYIFKTDADGTRGIEKESIFFSVDSEEPVPLSDLTDEFMAGLRVKLKDLPTATLDALENWFIGKSLPPRHPRQRDVELKHRMEAQNVFNPFYSLEIEKFDGLFRLLQTFELVSSERRPSMANAGTPPSVPNTMLN
jgi:hypothetical protein